MPDSRDNLRRVSAKLEIPHSSAEICLNLWYYVDRSGVVLRLAGKAYALCGSDKEKLAALHLLAGTDHLTATHGTVPARFILSSEHGKLKGAIPASAVFDDHGALFSPLINQIESELPKVIRSVADNFEQFTVTLPQDPLCVTTGVFESEDGELIARVAVTP
jgi:hypothetical protein